MSTSLSQNIIPQEPFLTDAKSLKMNERLSIPMIRHRLPCNTGNVNFDIYDYKMLFNDEKTREIIKSGNTIGCFYIESPGMRSLLKRLSCGTFEMLTAASSIIRPGVAESGMMQEFIARHKNPKRRSYFIPKMEEYLGETYGVMIYQEDVIKISHHIAGLTLEEGDLLRRAMSGKMRSSEAMERLQKKFFVSSKEKGLTDSESSELWRQIESFAGYAFCKAHSASFALLSFQVAYLKSHYPAQFMASVLSNGGGYYSSAVYIQECKRMGIKVLLPCINKSDYEYDGLDDYVRIGLMAVKNFSRNSAEKIIEERKANGKYISLADFLVRTRLGCEEISILIRCGAMGVFRQTRPTLMRHLDIYVNHRKLLDENYRDLFTHESFQLENKVATEKQYSLHEICAIEYEIFGYMVTRHPLYFYENILKRNDIIKSAEMNRYNGRTIKMVGWFMTSKRIKTKKGEIMKFLSLEDLTGTFEAVIFPKAYAKYANQTVSMGPYLLKGKVDMDGGNNIVVEQLAVLSVKEVKAASQKDSAENKYLGDVEKVFEEEFELAAALNTKKIKLAYCA
ncbi:MAG: hypothetical protein KJ799_00100 [Bacteroidetes bacterium]|nr:hypothetical protein [Bacteroidota bacterium]